MRKWLFLLGLVFVVSCSTIDCPVNNVVATRYRFYNADGDSLVLLDTLSVTSTRKDGTDTLILNRFVGGATFQLPISYSHPEDSHGISARRYSIAGLGQSDRQTTAL